MNPVERKVLPGQGRGNEPLSVEKYVISICVAWILLNISSQIESAASC